MHTDKIRARLDAMPAAMSAKGLRLPEAQFDISANADMKVYLKWNDGSGNVFRDEKYEFCRGSSPAEVLAMAESFIAALPSADETKRNTFMKALGKVIDLGNELGQDVGALMSEMKRISENAITDGRSIHPAE